MRKLSRHWPSTGLWRHPDFLKLWAGQTVSAFGSQITFLALPLTAVLVLGASPAQMGLLQALEWTPKVLFSLAAGVWTDRLRRKPILLVVNLGLAAAVGSVPIAASLGRLHIGQLYAVAFLMGSLSLLFGVANAAYLATLIGRDQLIEGNSKLQVTWSASAVMGPGITGALVQLLTAPPVSWAGCWRGRWRNGTGWDRR